MVIFDEQRRSRFYTYPTNLDQQIWRYMDLPKLVSLLEDASLFYPSAEVLGDKFEGSFSDLNRLDLERQLWCYRLQLTGAPYEITESSLHAFETQFMAQHESIAVLREWERKWTYISCWHANSHESAAMWRLYSKSDDVIAVQSTFQRLLDCVQPHRKSPHGEPILGMVHYFDPETERVQMGAHLSHFFSQNQIIRARKRATGCDSAPADQRDQASHLYNMISTRCQHKEFRWKWICIC